MDSFAILFVFIPEDKNETQSFRLQKLNRMLSVASSCTYWMHVDKMIIYITMNATQVLYE